MLAVHPCGQAVDFLRSGYHALMQTWDGADAPDPVPVVWFRVPPDTPFVPQPNVFTSRNWCDPKEWHSVGEQYTPQCDFSCSERQYYNGHPPAPYTALTHCGTDEEWYRGGIWGIDAPLVLLDNGVATCCVTAGIRAEGGEREGGTADQFSGFLFVSEGGERESGEAIQVSGVLTIADGGEREGGSGSLASGYLQAAEGGEQEGGSGSSGSGSLQAATGGEREGGSNTAQSGGVQVGSGGEREGGAASQFAQFAQFARGGEREGGASGFPAPCCPDWIHVPLYLHLSGFPCLDGIVLPFIPQPAISPSWQTDPFTICSMTSGNQLFLTCDEAGGFTMHPATTCADHVCCFPEGSPLPAFGTVLSCHPLEVAWIWDVDESCGGPGTIELTLRSTP